MPPKQRQIRMEQRGALSAMQSLESRSDEELERETKHKAAAQAILGARAAERYDAATARKHFQRAIAQSRPQERMALRRMADASLALAERRPDDLKAAVERLGQAPPSGRQLFLLRLMGLLAPPPGSPLTTRLRGIGLVVLFVVVILLVGFALAKLVALPFGGVSTFPAIFLGLIIVIAVLAGLAFFGRRKQAKAMAARNAAAAPPGRRR
ncbi:MAG TPA: hypothetical protein VN238_14005 [Solirubrobacteraceae bacterium]|nr:hypothetical protein [Solirubrobacteraceae bacterium]